MNHSIHYPEKIFNKGNKLIPEYHAFYLLMT